MKISIEWGFTQEYAIIKFEIAQSIQRVSGKEKRFSSKWSKNERGNKLADGLIWEK